MTTGSLDVTIDGRGVATVTLNDPERRNVLSAARITDLTQAARRLDAAPEVRAVVIAGRGPVFCAGGDLEWMRAQFQSDRSQRIAEARRLAAMFQALNTMRKPLIGRLHGGVFGGGIGLACVCDVAIAATETRFCFSETRLGIIPATIGPYVLARIGEGMARRVFMSARVFEAPEAEKLGVISRSVGYDELDEAVEAEVRPYLGVAPGAVGRAKALARRLGPPIDGRVIDASIEDLADAWETEEAAHGVAAFLEKTRPRWA